MKTNTRNKKISLLIVSITGIFLLSTLSEPSVPSGFSLIQGENQVFHQVSLIDVVAAIAADFLALAIIVLPLPIFHRAYHRIGVGAKIRRAVAYVTYVIEPKMKTAESMLLYLA